MSPTRPDHERSSLEECRYLILARGLSYGDGDTAAVTHDKSYAIAILLLAPSDFHTRRDIKAKPWLVRHTIATHLLRAGVDINTIRAWLGHVSLDTTNIYAEFDMERKAQALSHCEIVETKPGRRWKDDPDLMTFLKSL